jgi:hypothetical protein
VFPARCVEVTCQSWPEFPQICCGPGWAPLFHSLLYRSNPSEVLKVPNASEEHHAQLLAPVGLAAGLVLLGLVLGEVGSGRGEVGLALGDVGLELGDVGSELGEVGSALGDVGRDDGELGLCFGFGLCQCRCLCFGAGCPDLCFRAAST